jgi:hypothetical protein
MVHNLDCGSSAGVRHRIAVYMPDACDDGSASGKDKRVSMKSNDMVAFHILGSDLICRPWKPGVCALLSYVQQGSSLPCHAASPGFVQTRQPYFFYCA